MLLYMQYHFMGYLARGCPELDYYPIFSRKYMDQVMHVLMCNIVQRAAMGRGDPYNNYYLQKNMLTTIIAHQ